MPDCLIEEIVETVADNKGVEPTELEIVIADYIDLDAVNHLAEHSNTPWTLSFELPEHDVTVMSDGTVLVGDSREETRMAT